MSWKVEQQGRVLIDPPQKKEFKSMHSLLLYAEKLDFDEDFDTSDAVLKILSDSILKFISK